MSFGSRTSSNRSGKGSPDKAEPAEKPRKSADLLYNMVAQTLRDEIVGGLHPIGSLLPTEAELRDRFSVSRHTVREALRELREAGLVSSRQGSGTVVERLHRTGEFILKAETINELVSYSSEIWLELETVGMEVISGAAAERSGIPEGEEWLVARGFVTGAGRETPICWGEHFINAKYAEIARLLPLHRGPVFRLMEDTTGATIVEIEQQISGSLIAPELAARLGVEPASAGIDIKRIFMTADHRIAQITRHTHPASRFLYSTKMSRPRD